MNTTTTTTPAEIVAALKRHEIAAAEIVVQSATVARWGNSIAGQYVETVHEFKPGDVLTLRDWRPEGMMTTTPDGREMFIFWHFLEAMTTATTADEIRAAFDDYTDNGAGCEKFAALTEAASRADVSGDVDEFDGDRASEYETSARAFLTMTGAAFSARFLGMFDSLTEWGETENAGAVRGEIPVWRVTISTDGGKMSVRFRGSINDGRNGRTECGVYDVLAALVKSEPGTFDNFANEYGFFPIHSQAAYRRAERVFFACCREWRGVCRVWQDETDRDRLARIA